MGAHGLQLWEARQGMRSGSVSEMQKRAWGYYGFAGSVNKAVGEVRYVNGWLADQMSRLDWDVFIGGSDTWTVDLPKTNDESDAGRISTRTDKDEEDQTAASGQLLDLIDWNDTNVRGVTTNLFVGGEGDFIQTGKGWRVVSVVENDRKKKIEEATQRVPFLWPHPADPSKPDAPLFSVLEILDELDWYSRQARTQSKQRMLIAGVVATADSFSGPNGESFWTMWNETLSARMDNPDDLSPVRLEGPLEAIKDGINWIVPDFGYDDVLDRRVLACIHRLAYGLPVPPEILLGMQAQSRATAFQVEENAYRAHIEPPAMMVAQVAQDALNLLLDQEVEVVPNPSRLLARRQSVQDVKDAYDRGLVEPAFVREVLGIPEDAAPENDGVPPAGAPAVSGKDPANVAADEPVTAATKTRDLSDLLADIDASLSSELAGVTVMAVDRARQRLGAYARQNPTVKTQNRELTSSQLAVKLGFDGLAMAGVDVAGQIGEPVDSACRWWVRRIEQAWNQAATLIPGWSGQGAWVEESVDQLATRLAAHVIGTLGETDPPPLAAGDIRAVIDAAAGGGIT